MKWVFWICASLIAYTYLGYPLWLWLRKYWKMRPVRAANITPSVSIVIALHNEASVLPQKLGNLQELDYPADKLEVVLVSDGSSDGTDELLRSLEPAGTRVLVLPSHQGKAEALNRGIALARGEILVFTDARQTLEPDAVRSLVAGFADPAVGCVSGELMLGDRSEPAREAGIGLYWGMEKKIRQWEGATGSVVGATGALYAIRKELAVPLPSGTILDDVYIPLAVARAGKRVVFEPQARAWDIPSPHSREFRRKVRTLTGNYQLLQLAPWLLGRTNPVRFEFVSHKLFRLLMPFALAGALLSSLLIREFFYQIAAILQIAFYSSAMLRAVPLPIAILGQLANAAATFLVLNAAAVVALVNFLTGKKEVWVR
jgi:cellulose synthase/poly-beta-1,6-N-acetylglucosamine synthase-like glycosyltransferase